MLLWNGGCHVHEKFSVEAIVKLKQEHPEAVVMAHLECKAPVLAVADVKGSTATMLDYAKEHKEIEGVYHRYRGWVSCTSWSATVLT